MLEQFEIRASCALERVIVLVFFRAARFLLCGAGLA